MSRTDTFLGEIADILENNILSFWLNLKDPQGGFKPQVDYDGKIIEESPKGAILNARIIWAFSAAYKATRRQEYLIAATHAKDYFLAHFLDNKWGGVYWSLDSSGHRLDTKKQLYSQAFAIYGLSEYYSVVPDDQSIKYAVNLFKIVERYFSDRTHGGYKEALARDFSPLADMSLSEHDINAQKTMNSHLHLLEAYSNLYRVYPDELLRSRTAELLHIFQNHITAPSGHLHLYFNDNWTVIPGALSYGHDIETSWLAMEAAFTLRDADIVDKIRPVAKKMATAGLEGLREDGSLIYERHYDGTIDSSRQWWVEAEAVVGNLWLWKYHGDSEAFSRALKTWDYIKEHLVDRNGGEWFWSSEEDHSHSPNDKAGFWKCPYHNTRMCLQALELL